MNKSQFIEALHAADAPIGRVGLTGNWVQVEGLRFHFNATDERLERVEDVGAASHFLSTFSDLKARARELRQRATEAQKAFDAVAHLLDGEQRADCAARLSCWEEA